MGKKADTSVLDGLLDVVATATRMTVTSAEPANFAGIAAVALADDVLASGDFTKAAGDVSGRKVTVAQQADIAIDIASGTASHVCLDDGTTLLYVTTATEQALTLGGTVTVPQFDIEVAAPA